MSNFNLGTFTSAGIRAMSDADKSLESTSALQSVCKSMGLTGKHISLLVTPKGQKRKPKDTVIKLTADGLHNKTTIAELESAVTEVIWRSLSEDLFTAMIMPPKERSAVQTKMVKKYQTQKSNRLTRLACYMDGKTATGKPKGKQQESKSVMERDMLALAAIWKRTDDHSESEQGELKQAMRDVIDAYTGLTPEKLLEQLKPAKK